MKNIESIASQPGINNVLNRVVSRRGFILGAAGVALTAACTQVGFNKEGHLGPVTPTTATGGGNDYPPTPIETVKPIETVVPPTAEPARIPTTIKPAEILPLTEVPKKLDALAASVKALPKSFNPNDTFFEEQTKKSIIKTIDVIKDDLRQNKIADARIKLQGNDFNLRIRILELGDSDKGIRDPEIRAKYDPEGLFTQFPDLVDLSIKEPLYIPAMEIYQSVFYNNPSK